MKFIFDKKSRMWSDNSKYNEMLIKSTTAYLQDWFKMDGVLLVKDVLKLFGLPVGEYPVEVLTKYWIYGEVESIPITVVDLKDGTYELDLKFKEDING